jgi:hypothetical protein
MLAEHKIDVYATNKANLFEMSDALPGSRVLDGRWGLENLATWSTYRQACRTVLWTSMASGLF